jgi:hypothetical protein
VSKQVKNVKAGNRYYDGAGSRIRTDDLLITNQLLYQLSYAGIYHVNESNKVRVIDGLSIAQADKNESQEKRYQLRVVWVKCKGGDYEN